MRSSSTARSSEGGATEEIAKACISEQPHRDEKRLWAHRGELRCDLKTVGADAEMVGIQLVPVSVEVLAANLEQGVKIFDAWASKRP